MGELDGLTRGDVEPEQRPAAVLVGLQQHGVAGGVPGDRARPLVERVGDRADDARGDVEQAQLAARGRGGGAGAAVHHQRAGAVGADRAGAVVGAGDALDQVRRRAGRHVDLDDRRQPIPQGHGDRAARQHERPVGGHVQAVGAQVGAQPPGEQAQPLARRRVDGARQVRVGCGRGVGRVGLLRLLGVRGLGFGGGGVLDREQVGGVGAQVGVPVAHGGVGVQARGDLGVLALLAQVRVDLLGVVGRLGRRHQRGHHEHAAVAAGVHRGDAARA